MRPNSPFVQAATLLAFGLLATSLPAADGPYHFLKEIHIGGEGAGDYLSIDSGGRKLFVSHGTKVVVIDLEKDQVLGEITDTPGVHGVAVAPLLRRGFSSNGRENKVSIVDLDSLNTLSKVDTGQNPDAILFESGRKEVYAFNGRAQSATVIDAASGKVAATIPLLGKPEFAVAEPKTGRVFCNIEDKNEVCVIDCKQHRVVATWPITPGQGASGMAIDLDHNRIFLGCGNRMMVMMDNVNGKIASMVPIGQGVDANAFDPGTQYAFASCGDGTVTIAHEDSPEKLTLVQTLKTERGAKTMALDAKTHKIYLSTVNFEAPAAGQPEGGRQRPKVVPDTFKVLVYGM